ncbi:type II secretion system protein N [Ketobacter sp.]|uniref:type II secretion system protein N n=1 Tax=Ketobacter sp. TaxID=2083498 RepID=UPI000F12B126|nr:type II secretion system protein N [Ketobacter sp.]RLT93271.1 MAG: hypothetical protein D9N14_19055 [Ketobacter sp.]
MKIRNLILIGVLSCIVFAIALFPASILWSMVSGSAGGLPVQVERVGGTVWNGYAVGRLRTQIVRGPVVVDWDLKGLRLLLGEVAIVLRAEGNDFRVSGAGHWGLWGTGVSHLNGDVQAELLNQSLRQFGISASGVINIENISVNLSGQTITNAEGWIRWSGGRVKAPGSGSRTPLDIPPVNGQVREEEGSLFLTVTEAKGNQLLGEAGLLPEKGLGSLKVLQRVLSLVGMGAEGGDDKVLVNMQQPLPF